jgi:radical SAM protein with 4Fe4S-binding SPASM domain
MNKVIAVLSMLHEPADRRCSAARPFRGEAVLGWTLFRLRRASRVWQSAVLCWDDQESMVATVAKELNARCVSRGPRTAVPTLDAVSAARRWADGWRGGLLGTCEFDRGFHAPWIAQLQQEMGGDAVVLVDPAAAMVDPVLIDALIDHAAAHEEYDFCFSQAAPGLSGVLIGRATLEQLSATSAHPGTLVSYRPDSPMRDPISAASCVPIPTPLARATQRFTLDSDRQVERVSAATAHLNGELVTTEAEQLLYTLSCSPHQPTMPRELVLELTPRRQSRPIFEPASHLNIERPDLAWDDAAKILDELGGVDDARLMLAGVGDPLLHERALDLIDAAHQAGVAAIALETDLLGVGPEIIDRLAGSAVDIVSVNLPAITDKTYAAVMGVDGSKTAIENLRRLVGARQGRGRGTPLVVPIFVKTNLNLAEMESWYDHWLTALRCGVIAGPADYAGQIPDVSVAQMEPPRRRPCARLASRITILSDGRAVSCEQDVLGRQPIGNIRDNSLAEIWKKASTIRADHAAGRWQQHPLCAACRDWHRA